MKVVLQSPRFHVLFKHFWKAAFIVAISLMSTSSASAQHCDGCNVNIVGEETVHVGDTKRYYVTPRYPYAEYTPIWDYDGDLWSVATIVDQGKDASDNEYIVLYFYAEGHPWLDYVGLYDGITEDYDEITLHIYP